MTKMISSAAQKQKLAFLASQEKVSIAEIRRRAIEQYLTLNDESTFKILNLLLDDFIESNRRAEEALDKANAAVSETLQQLAESRKKREQHGNFL